MSLNQELSDLFGTLAAIMEIRGESPFKAIAFSKVSRRLKETAIDLRDAVESDRLKEIEGIGPSSQKIIEEFVRTGKSRDFEEVAATIPAGLIPMLRIPGLGPKTISLFWKERGITSQEELVQAIEQGKLAGLKGIGEKKIESIKQGIALLAAAGGRIGIVEALPIGHALLAQLKAIPAVAEAELGGSLRRRRETIGDIDLLCAPKDGSSDGAARIAADFAAFPQVTRVLAQGPTKVSVLIGSVQVDLRIVPPASFGAALQYFTGSKEHNTRLRALAQEKAMTLNEWGLYRTDVYDKSKKKSGAAPEVSSVAGWKEEDIYRALGLEWMEPELREDQGEIAAAAKHTLPRLIAPGDIHGDLHCHTNASDGSATIEQMAEAAIRLGYKFLAITDHSKSSVIANGLSAERLVKHVREIHRVSEKMAGITLLAGCEVDILSDGRLDFEDAILAELDWVVASPHVALKQAVDPATERLLRAIENPYVNVIGHPTGRLIGRREGLPLNFPRIFKAAADTGTALEINAGWPRLDLNDVHAHAALTAGVMLCIDTDAHSVEGLGEINWGLNVARRAWCEARSVVNCMTLAQLRQFVKKKRK